MIEYQNHTSNSVCCHRCRITEERKESLKRILNLGKSKYFIDEDVDWVGPDLRKNVANFLTPWWL